MNSSRSPASTSWSRRADADPVVGDAVLREVVGADLLGALAAADLRLARRRLLGLLALALRLVQAGAEDAHRLRLVLELRALVLHRDHDPGRQVRDPDRRVGRVHRLAARARRAVDVDLEVLLVDLDVDILGLGHHGDRRGRGVDPALRLGVGHALDAVRAALVLEDRVRAVALDRVDALLDPAAVARAHLELLPLEAAPLGVALEHPREVGGPERRLVAADALADLDDHVLLVGRVALDERELQLLLEPGDLGLVVGDHLGELGVGLARPRGRRAPGATACGEPVRPLELLQAPADLLRLAVVVVDRRIRHAVLRLLVGALELLDELVETGHGRLG